jgi:hypothetical protein
LEPGMLCLDFIVTQGQIGDGVAAPTVTMVLAVPVSTFLTVTIASAIAPPDASWTTPDMVPVVTWA